MTFNNFKMIRKISGRNIHRFLIKESYRIFTARGYLVEIEKRLDEKKRLSADLFCKKGRQKIVVECLVKPSKTYIEDKKKTYSKYCDKMVLVYPSHFIPTIPLEQYFDEVLSVDVPEKIIEKTMTIRLSDETWKRLMDLKKNPSQTFDMIIDEALNSYQKGGNKK